MGELAEDHRVLPVTAWPKRTSGRTRSQRLGQPPRPACRAAAAATGTSSSRTSAASSSTAMPRMTPISFGGSGPRQREGEEHGDHHRARRRRPRGRSARRRRPSPRCGSLAAVPVLLRRARAGTPCSPSRSRRSSRRRTPGPRRRGSPATRSRAGRRRWPSWKISLATPNAAPVASRFVTTPTAAMIGACSATSSSRKPSASTTPMTSGVLVGERRLEVVVLGDRAADERARGQLGAQPVDRRADGRVGRVRASGRPGPARCRRAPGCGGMTCAMPGSAFATRGDLRGVGLRARRSAARRARPGRTPPGPAS